MKIAHKFSPSGNQGYALLITVVFIGIAMLLLGSVMNWSNSTARQTERNNLFNMGVAAAEAATERTMSVMSRDFYNQNFDSTSNYTGYYPSAANQSGWPVKFSFSNGSGVPDQTGVSTSPTDWTTNWQALNLFGSRYAGLSAFVAQCTVTSTATPTNEPYAVSATVQQKFLMAAIPIFQNAVFYNLDMEIDPGADMNLNGPVFSNGGMWVGAGDLTFNSSVEAAGTVDTNWTDDPYMTPGSKSGTGAATYSTNYNNGKPLSNQDSLTMPIGQTNDPTAIRSLLGLPPAGTDPDSSEGQQYFYNQTDLIISNSPGGAISAYFQVTNNVSPTLIPYDATKTLTVTTTNGYTYTTNVTSHTHNNRTTYTTNITSAPITSSYTTNIAYYSFATNATFYDYREGKTVEAVQLNVGALNAGMSSTNTTGGGSLNAEDQFYTGHAIDSVYIYNNAPSDSSDLPSVRVANGATLPNDGLTVVTPDPLYVLGNYNASSSDLNTTNTADTKPAALMGDAITVLSPNWSDSYSLSHTGDTNPNNRGAAATTVNAATFQGIVPSNGNNYSGGVENFLRMLENWNGVQLTYNGSIVVMYPSQYATNNWSYGSYYTAPNRKWGFDLNFTRLSGLPPLTPRLTKLLPEEWASY
jgi:hypothetical protein